jgi:diacylglycerol kinase family enzyme
MLPVSGITLPFLSAGGSSLVITMMGAGILANVARQTPPERKPRGAAERKPRGAAEKMRVPATARASGR